MCIIIDNPIPTYDDVVKQFTRFVLFLFQFMTIGLAAAFVILLLKRELLPNLRQYLEEGGRKIDTWYAQRATALTDFSEYPDAFLNINTEEERRELERKLTGGQR